MLCNYAERNVEILRDMWQSKLLLNENYARNCGMLIKLTMFNLCVQGCVWLFFYCLPKYTSYMIKE